MEVFNLLCIMYLANVEERKKEYKYIPSYIQPLALFTPTGSRTPRGLVSTRCLCNYMSEYECMYVYTAVLLPQVYTICIVYNLQIYVHEFS